MLSTIFQNNNDYFSSVLKKAGTATTQTEVSWSQESIVWITESVHVKQFLLIEGKPSRTRVLISWK